MDSARRFCRGGGVDCLPVHGIVKHAHSVRGADARPVVHRYLVFDSSLPIDFPRLNKTAILCLCPARDDSVLDHVSHFINANL